MVSSESCNAWLDPNPQYSILVGVDKFCPDSLQGTCCSFLTQRLVSTFRSDTMRGAWRSARDADRHSESCASKFFLFLPWVTNNQLFFQFPIPAIFFLFSPLWSRQTTLIWHHDILKHSASWYGISLRLPCNRSRQLKHRPGTHFSISLLCLLSSSPLTPPPLTFSGGKYLTASYRVPCAVWHGPGCGRDMYIDKTVLLRVAADILR